MLKHIKNPMVLATIAVALLALLAGIIINYNFSGEPYAAASGALYGATASALTGILAYMLGTVDTREVPLAFIEAARSDVLDIGYYKRDFKFEVNLHEEDSTWILTIVFSSRIIPVTSTARMKMPLVIPPDKLRNIIASKEITYKLDGRDYNLDQNNYVPLQNEIKEECKIKYKLKNIITDAIEDDHRTWCPIMNETVRVKLPIQYDFSVVGLRGEADIRLSKTSEGNDGSSEFRRAEAHFSHQGFKWKLSLRSDCVS